MFTRTCFVCLQKGHEHYHVDPIQQVTLLVRVSCKSVNNKMFMRRVYMNKTWLPTGRSWTWSASVSPCRWRERMRCTHGGRRTRTSPYSLPSGCLMSTSRWVRCLLLASSSNTSNSDRNLCLFVCLFLCLLHTLLT